MLQESACRGFRADLIRRVAMAVELAPIGAGAAHRR
jgi:hypothetical protein